MAVTSLRLLWLLVMLSAVPGYACQRTGLETLRPRCRAPRRSLRASHVHVGTQLVESRQMKSRCRTPQGNLRTPQGCVDTWPAGRKIGRLVKASAACCRGQWTAGYSAFHVQFLCASVGGTWASMAFMMWAAGIACCQGFAARWAGWAGSSHGTYARGYTSESSVVWLLHRVIIKLRVELCDGMRYISNGRFRRQSYWCGAILVLGFLPGVEGADSTAHSRTAYYGMAKFSGLALMACASLVVCSSPVGGGQTDAQALPQRVSRRLSATQPNSARRRKRRLRPGGAQRSVLCGSKWINIPRPQDKKRQIGDACSYNCLTVSAVSVPSIKSPDSPVVKKARKARKKKSKAHKADSRGEQVCRFHVADSCKRSQCPYGPVGHAPPVDEPDTLDPLVEARFAQLHEELKQEREAQSVRDTLLQKELNQYEEQQQLLDERISQAELIKTETAAAAAITAVIPVREPQQDDDFLRQALQHACLRRDISNLETDVR
jgi:hypothetical protein